MINLPIYIHCLIVPTIVELKRLCSRLINVSIFISLKIQNNNEKCEFYYKIATDLYKDDSPRSTFQKYLHWDNKIIKHFTKYFKNVDSSLLDNIYSMNLADKEFKTHIHDYYY